MDRFNNISIVLFACNFRHNVYCLSGINESESESESAIEIAGENDGGAHSKQCLEIRPE
jgi:hypothetical protein